METTVERDSSIGTIKRLFFSHIPDQSQTFPKTKDPPNKVKVIATQFPLIIVREIFCHIYASMKFLSTEDSLTETENRRNKRYRVRGRKMRNGYRKIKEKLGKLRKKFAALEAGAEM